MIWLLFLKQLPIHNLVVILVLQPVCRLCLLFLRRILTILQQQSKKIQGDVIIDFTVTPKGVVANSRITKGLHPDIDKEVLGTLKKMSVLELSEKDRQKFDTDYKITMNFALPDGILLTKPTMSITEVETENLKMTVMKGEKRNETSGTVIVSTASVTHTEPKNLEATTTECKSGSYIITTRDSSGIKKDAVPTKQVIIMTKDEYTK